MLTHGRIGIFVVRTDRSLSRGTSTGTSASITIIDNTFTRTGSSIAR